jgi:hypothetical protein
MRCRSSTSHFFHRSQLRRLMVKPVKTRPAGSMQ